MIKYIFKKRVLVGILTICFLSLLLSPQIIFAQASLVTDGLKKTAEQATISTEEVGLDIMIGSAINYIFGIIGVIFLTIVLVGGYLWMTAGGNEEKVEKGKKFVINGINGMIVIFLAYALVFVILQALSGAAG